MTHGDSVYRAVQPFSRAIDSTICVRQEHLDELQGTFAASDNPDFEIGSYQSDGLHALPQGRLYHLPFKLALGIHCSVEPVINQEATHAVYDAYLEAGTRSIKSFRTNFEVRNHQRDRVDSAIIGALIEAATDRTQGDAVMAASSFARKAKLITATNRINLNSLIKTMSVQ